MPAIAQAKAIATAKRLLANGQTDQALVIAQRLADANPESAAGHNLMAVVAVLDQRAESALHHANLAAQLAPRDAAVQFTLGRAHKLAGDAKAAIVAYRRALALQPGYAEAHVSLGNALREDGQLQAAIESYQQALAINPKLGVAHANLAHALALHAEQVAQTQTEGALVGHEAGLPSTAALEQTALAAQLDPRNAALWRNYGLLLQRARRYGDAANAFNQALGIDPSHLDCCLNLGLCLQAQARSVDAVALYEQWLARNRHAAPVMHALANQLSLDGRVADAVRWAEAALALDGGAASQGALLNAYHQCRRLDEALAAGARAVEASGRHPASYPLYLMCLNYVAKDPQEVFAKHAEFGCRVAATVPKRAAHVRAAPSAPAATARALRVGYISGDFASHSVSYFMSGLLERHDRQRFEVFCYFNRVVGDGVTDKLKALGHHWLGCAGMPDDHLAQLIEADEIDVLVDLSGHTANNRLSLFAMRVAPVQLSYLGYPTITGVQEIDFRITDTTIDPGDMPALTSELPLHLPRSMFCYRPSAAPAIGPPPALRNGGITFGSFNNIAKLSDHTLRLWARALHAVPGSRLLLKSPATGDAATRANITAFMQAQGVSSERLTMRGREAHVDSHLAVYNEVDIALDPYPYNGATTTCEALWMGVPVLSLRGRTHTSRMGESILSAAGRPQWVSANEDEHLACIQSLADDSAQRAAWRSQARATLQASALMDEVGFTNCFEDAIAAAWVQRTQQSHPPKSTVQGAALGAGPPA